MRESPYPSKPAFSVGGVSTLVSAICSPHFRVSNLRCVLSPISPLQCTVRWFGSSHALLGGRFAASFALLRLLPYVLCNSRACSVRKLPCYICLEICLGVGYIYIARAWWSIFSLLSPLFPIFSPFCEFFNSLRAS